MNNRGNNSFCVNCNCLFDTQQNGLLKINDVQNYFSMFLLISLGLLCDPIVQCQRHCWIRQQIAIPVVNQLGTLFLPSEH